MALNTLLITMFYNRVLNYIFTQKQMHCFTLNTTDLRHKKKKCIELIICFSNLCQQIQYYTADQRLSCLLTIIKHLIAYGFFRFSEYDKEHTTGETAQQRMLIPKRQLNLPLIYFKYACLLCSCLILSTDRYHHIFIFSKN